MSGVWAGSGRQLARLAVVGLYRSALTRTRRGEVGAAGRQIHLWDVGIAGRGYGVAGIDTPAEIAETGRALGLDAPETGAHFEGMANLLPGAPRETVEDPPEALQSLPMVADYCTNQTDRARRCEQIAATARVEAAAAARPAGSVHDAVTYLRALGVGTEPVDTRSVSSHPCVSGEQ